VVSPPSRSCLPLYRPTEFGSGEERARILDIRLHKGGVAAGNTVTLIRTSHPTFSDPSGIRKVCRLTGEDSPTNGRTL
jgi:hypothetical protein